MTIPTHPHIRKCILTHILRGEGTPNDPVRRVLQVHSERGDFLAEADPFQPTTQAPQGQEPPPQKPTPREWWVCPLCHNVLRHQFHMIVTAACHKHGTDKVAMVHVRELP